MKLKNLRLSQFRCHPFFEADFSSPFNLIIGPNGKGKTALLEAIYYMSHLRSFRTTTTCELIQHQKEQFSIRLHYGDNVLKVNWAPHQKELWFNETLVKAVDFVGVFSCVALTTSDINLCRGSSEMRHFLNHLLTQWNKKNLIALIRYHKILKERSAWLKEKRGDLLVFKKLTSQLEKAGKPLQRSRYHIAKLVGKIATFFYEKLSGSREILALDYQLNGWDFSLETEKQQGYSLNGFHRDPITFLLNQKSLASYGSEGQLRTAVIALKLAEIVLLHRKQEKAPIILVDDIWGELDIQRRRALLELIQEPYQIFVTTTSAQDWENQLKFCQKIAL